MLLPFVYLLKDLGIPVSFQYVMEFFKGLEKGLVRDLESLFLFSRLVFVKKVEHYDLFERAFAAYFLGQEEALAVDVESILASKSFRDWLEKFLEEANLGPEVIHNMTLDELLKKFWDTLLKQEGEHRGGSRWIGVGGTSPWGHSGRARGGIRLGGASGNRSAMKVFGEHRYIDYSGESTLSAENIRQALSLMKRMVPVGPSTELNIEDTIDETCRQGGEIELVFERELRDRIQVMVFLDNGGYSMSPFVQLVRLLFSKMKSQFKDLDFYYFHNTIYSGVYSDVQRSQFLPMEKVVQKDKKTRLFIVGDANMGPYELLSPYGSINYYGQHPVPSIEWLKMLAGAFPYSVWLNPLPRMYWPFESSTIEYIGDVFYMEELTLNGLKKTVEYLRERE